MSYLNILDFGAKGDGSHDDTAALVSAMDAAARENGTVYIPSGNYMIAPVHVPSHITLLGNSCWSENDLGRTVLTALREGKSLLDLDATCGSRIIGLTLDGRGLGEHMHGVYSIHGGVEQNNCYEDCRITNFTGCGLKLDWVWVFAVRRCLIDNNGLHGIDLDRGYDGWVIDNRIISNCGAGVNAGPGMVCYTADRFENNALGGIICDNTQNINVTGCIFNENSAPAISFNNSRASSVSGCVSRGKGGFLLESSFGLAVTGNVLSGEIVEKDLTDSVISGNVKV